MTHITELGAFRPRRGLVSQFNYRDKDGDADASGAPTSSFEMSVLPFCLEAPPGPLAARPFI